MNGMLAPPAPAAPADAQQAAPAEQQGDLMAKAMEVVQQSLYGAEAALDVSKALKSAPSVEQGLAETAYEMVAVADEAVGGLPDEGLVGFAAEVLGEVADIAEAAGIKVKGAQIAKAVQMMLVRFVTEQGLDPTQLQQAMAQVDPDKVGAQLDKGM
jgi:hypothetical protein